MSLRWVYIVLVIVLISWLRYIGYKRSRRVEKKLDLIMGALGVEYKDDKTVEKTDVEPKKLGSLAEPPDNPADKS